MTKWKDIIRSIWESFGRFLSILCIVLLGVSFFVGLKTAGPSMHDTSKKYFEDYHLPDGKIVANYGIDKEDLEELNKLDDIHFQAMQSHDASVKETGNRLRLYTKTDKQVGMFKVTQGRLPKEVDEIAIDQELVNQEGKFKIGDKITLEELDKAQKDKEDKDGDGETIKNRTAPHLKETSYTIVGFVDSPLYLSRIERGYQLDGQAELNGFALVDYKAITGDLWSEVYYWSEKLEKIDPYTPAYDKEAEIIQDDIENQLNPLIASKTADIKKSLTDLYNKAKDKVDQGDKEIQAAREQIDQAQKQIDAQQAQLDQLPQVPAELKAQIDQAQETLDDKKKTLKEKEGDLKDGKKKVSNLDTKIKDFKSMKYVVEGRDKFIGYKLLKNNAEKVVQLSNVFPVLFLVLALLVTYITMTRMTQEERVYIGTMKQMGYSNMTTRMKFITYALLSSAIGASIGAWLGYKILPKVILQAYQTLHYFDEPIISLSWGLIVLTIVIALLSALIPTLYTSSQLLTYTPAELLVPAAPTVGGAIWLERFTSIWNRLAFLTKLTWRNIFRYKSRSLLIVIGVASSTLLIVTGFGLSDSLNGTVNRQFDDIIHYTSIVTLDDEVNEDKIEKDIKNIKGVDTLAPVYSQYLTVEDNDKLDQTIHLLVPVKERDQFDKLITLQTPDTQERINLLSKTVAVTPQLAKNFAKDDELTVKDADDLKYTVKIDKVSENYVGHTLYMGTRAYEDTFNQTATINGFLVSYTQGSKYQDMEKEIRDLKGIKSVHSMESVKESAVESMNSLNVITLVLILAAGGLAFVVLYNLINIMIHERFVEIATIKVLGFTAFEVTRTVFDEVFILTAVGILLGCLGGDGLNRFIVGLLSRDDLAFKPLVHMSSFLYAIGLTVGFVLVIMLIMYRQISQIDMVEAMKEAE